MLFLRWHLKNIHIESRKEIKSDPVSGSRNLQDFTTYLSKADY